MNLTAGTHVGELLKKYPFLVDFLIEVNGKFKLLKNPVMRNTVANVATLQQISAIGGIAVEKLIADIAKKIESETGTKVAYGSETIIPAPITDPRAKHEMLREIIRSLHDGGDFNEAKRQFSEVVRDVNASEIAAMEQKLIAEGMPQSEVKRLCDVHVQVFKESIDVKEVPSVPEGHPVHTFLVENRALEKLMERVKEILGKIGEPYSVETYKQYNQNIKKLLDSLQKVHLHYLRKENQLFPILEKHDVTGPSQVMWSLDDDIRGMIKRCTALHESADLTMLVPACNETLQALADMIYKEERILFPMAVDLLSQDEWQQVRRGESEIGYAWIIPSESITSDPGREQPAMNDPGLLSLDTGVLSPEQINLMLKNLPVDISYVDEHDEVRYYSNTAERIFPRSPGVIGRKVQNCHPPKSMHVVQKILDDFRSGQRDTAEFWINLQNKFIHIRYFAMRDRAGEYKGCLEVSQDASGIRSLEGEKRLLD